MLKKTSTPKSSVGAAVALLFLCAVIGFCGDARAHGGEPFSSELVPDSDVNEGSDRQQPSLWKSQPSAADELVDKYLFGSPGANAIAAAQHRLELKLLEKIDFDDGVCQLTGRQRDKLRLAGEGDIKRLFDQVEIAKRKFQFMDDHGVTTLAGMRIVQREFNPLRIMLSSDSFRVGSLYAKTTARVLTSEQLARCRVVDSVSRLGGKIECRTSSREASLAVIFVGVELTDEQFAKLELQGLGNLKALHLAGTRMTDTSLANMHRLTQLERLSINMMDVTDAGLAGLSALTNLKSLSLTNIPVSNAGLRCLLPLTNLEQLDLPEHAVGDTLPLLQKLPNLRSLTLHENLRVTERGSIEKMRNVPVLNRGRP